MTIYAAWINASAGSPSYSAAGLRTSEAPLWTPSGPSRPLGSLSGRRVGGGLEVSLVGGSNTITIQPGAALLDVETPVATGSYRIASDAVDTSCGNLTAANASNPRIDIVSIQLGDTDVDGSGNRAATFVYTTGVANASPVAPATPVRSLRLCSILVPKVGAGSPVVTMDSTFAVASGGVLPCLSTAKPANPYAGQTIYMTDLKSVAIYDGTAWSDPGYGVTRPLNVVAGSLPPAGVPIRTYVASFVPTASSGLWTQSLAGLGISFSYGWMALLTPGDSTFGAVAVSMASSTLSTLAGFSRDGAGAAITGLVRVNCMLTGA